MYIKVPPGPSLPEMAFIISHPLDLNLFLSFMPKPIKKLPICLAKLYIFPTLSVIGPCLGRPQLLIILEHLKIWGGKTFLFLGWCGGLSPILSIGDMVIPHTATSEYQIPSYVSTVLFKHVKTNMPFSFHTGSIISVDNPYVLDLEKIHNYQKQGIMAIDMETEALFSRSSDLGISSVSLLIVSDLLTHAHWKQGFFSPPFKNRRKMVLEWLSRLYF